MTENELAKIVFESGLKIHKSLGAGLLESAYQECLCYELRKKNLEVEREKKLPVIYEGIQLQTNYHIDLLVEKKLIVQVRSVDKISDLHLAQVLTYLRHSQCKLGLLINFNTTLFKNGVKRIINGTLKEE